MTTADMLYPHMRETIEKVFRSPVFNRYGSREVGIIACECEKHEGLHVFSPIIHVEILKQDCIPTAVGEMGEVVITSMFNYAMPLIRYKIGDTGIWAENECSCGRKLPLLKQITGRVTDTFYKKDHTQVYGGYFNRLFYFRDWVKKFQVIQEDYDEIRLIIIPQKTSENIRELYYQQLNEITTKIQLVLGKECRVNYEFVTDIPPTASGKYRYTISKVKNK
jgi:phenylacetate-CoA ligase